jgi:agmatinase
MFCRAVKEGLIDPKHSVQIGIRTWNDDFMGINVLDAPWIHSEGAAAALARVIEFVDGHPAYLTFDIDCLDPAFAPGTGTPVPGGLSTAQALQIVRGLESVNLVGIDIVEVAPAYDQSEITALAAAHIAADLLCVLRNRKISKQPR